tara:strand:- start:2033 stop:2530 length:498 start_codon:yes stop_codon:yes gene_type:complete
MEYRLQSDGTLKNQGEIRKLNPNVSFPRVWDADVCAELEIDPVLAAPKPEPSAAYKQVGRNGAVQDASNNWVEAYIETDMFSDTTVDGVTTTKAEHETAYQARLDADAAKSVRATRDGLLTGTDWHGMSDVTMSADMTTYRQALRDITAHADFPNLEDSDWPTAP